MADSLDIEQNLKNLGLTSDEARIYRHLLSDDTLSIIELSHKINIPRTTLYRIIDSMKAKGFVRVLLISGTKKVEATPPDMLHKILQLENEKLQKLRRAINTLESILPSPRNSKIQTEVKFYLGLSGMKQLVWNVLRAKKTLGYTIWGRDMVIGKDFDRKLMAEYRKRKMQDYIIIKDSTAKMLVTAIKTKQKGDVDPPYKGLQHVRILRDKDFCLYGDTYIYDDTYAVNYWDEGEIVGVEIRNPEIAKIQEGIFWTLWEISQPFNNFLKKYDVQ
ncbi:MAG: helix-turn-helix domain-containing protein [Candidatus Dojkabacteria bacterium]|nr:helix-turn-helix domain-containing protein [Candidatus Dojkabacteria bacterium]